MRGSRVDEVPTKAAPIWRLAESPAYLVAMLSIAGMFNMGDRMMFSVALSPIKAEFGFSDSQLGVLSGFAFALFYAGVAVPISRLTRYLPRVTIMAICLGLWSLATGLTALVSGFATLFAARMVIGIGEGGGTPMTLSLIAARYPAERRTMPIGIFTTAVYVGLILGEWGAGKLIGEIGWRHAFLVLGLPGLLLALLMRLTVAEPCDLETAPPPNWHRVSELRHNRAWLHVVGLLIAASFVGYADTAWAPSFYQRSFGMSVEETGFVTGIALGMGSTAGAFLAGMIVPRGEKRRPGYGLWLTFVTTLIAVPLSIASFAVTNQTLSVLCLLISTVLGSIPIVVSYAALQSLVLPSLRPTATALAASAYILIGLGAGPAFVGSLSDALTAHFSGESLRAALVIVNILMAWMLWHAWRAMKLYPAALAAVES